MKFSRWADRILHEQGIINLMKDLGNATERSNMPLCMLGGGNPAHIPELEQYFRDQMQKVMQSESRFEQLIGDYAGPQGLYEFSEALAKLLQKNFGWDIGSENIAVANGSQMAFTILFRLFSGPYSANDRKQILLPMTPEYIGYNEADEVAPRFRSLKPKIVEISQNTFKYEVNFNELEMTDQVGAICVSRPTNPTGNMVTDKEMEHLAALAKNHQVPLIVDGAYGLPFPNIVYSDQPTVTWDQNTILVLSLSKLGLPGTRTGIIVARPQVIELFTCANAIMTLASGNFGSVLTLNAVKSGELLELSKNVIQPYYKRQMDHVVDVIHSRFQDLPYMLHVSEGAFFVWLWFPDLPISDEQLYQRLKQKNVYVVPGSYFFPGLKEQWKHRFECIRISYAGSKDSIARGLDIIAGEVRSVFLKRNQETTV